MKMCDEKLLIAIQEFLGIFEVVVHHDWAYSQANLCSFQENETLLSLQSTDSMDNWSNGEELLEKYYALKELLAEHGLASIINPMIKPLLQESNEFLD